MPTQNPTATQEKTITSELLNDLESGKVKMLDLAKSDPETFKKVEEFLDNPNSALPESNPNKDLSNKEDEAPGAKKEEDKTVPKDYVPGDKFKKKADEANEYKLKWESSQKRLRELEERVSQPEKKEIVTPKPGEVWSDEHQLDVAKTVAELRQKVEQLEKGKLVDDQGTLDKVRKERDEYDFRMLQNDFEEFKTDETLESMEKRYADFFYKVGAKPEDTSPVAKYFSDAAFRVAMEAAGVKAPKDFDKINTLLQARNLRDKLQKEDSETTLSDAIAISLRRQNKLKDMLKAERLKGAADVADKIHNAANETITMQPGASGGGSSDEMTEAQAWEWMQKNPHPKTKDQIAAFRRVEAFLDSMAAQ